jgi:hypothetical protein
LLAWLLAVLVCTMALDRLLLALALMYCLEQLVAALLLV